MCLLIILLESHNIPIVCLQEVRWHPIHNPPPPVIAGYRVYYQHHDYADYQSRRGGVATLVRQDILCFERNDLSSGLCVKWMELQLTAGDKLLLGNIYVPPYDADMAMIPTLSDALTRLPAHTLLCGDFNARNLMWDAQTPPHGRSTTAGWHVDALIQRFNLVLLNPLEPTFVTRHSESTIDLVLSTALTAAKAECVVTQFMPFSQHRPLQIDLQAQAVEYVAEPSKPKWCLREAVPELFKVATEFEFKALIECLPRMDLDDQVKAIQEGFTRSGESSMSKTRGCIREQTPYMTKELRRLRKSRDKALHFHICNPGNAEQKRRYECAFRAYEQALHEAIPSADLLFLRSISEGTNLEIWNALTVYTGKRAPPLFPALDGGRATSNAAKAESLRRFFASVCAPHDPNDHRFDASFYNTVLVYLEDHATDFSDTSVNELYNCPLTENELAMTLNNIKNSSAGHDDIPPWFYKNAGVSARKCLLLLYNASFAAGRLPEVFKKADLVAIPKPGRDHTEEKNYRPISLILVMSRIFENVMHRRVYHWAESSGHIPRTQFAFRHNHSSVHPLICLTQSIQHGFNTGKQTCVCHLDLKKAFDTVSPEILKFKLHKLGLRGRMLSWLSDFVSARKYRVVRPSTTEYSEFGIGVPQGSGLSPLLFILFIADCSHRLKCSHVEFADDITLWYSSSDPHVLQAMLTADLAIVEQWAREMRMLFGDKNKYCIFYPRGAAPFDLELIGGLTFFSHKLQKCDSLLLLGLHLDCNLSFKLHTDYLVASTKRRGNMLRCLMGTRLVNNAAGLLVLYKGWIRSKIEYASEVYSCFARVHAQRLEQAQAHCLRIITGARECTPHSILQNETSVSSLTYRRAQNILRMYAKILALPRDHILRDLLRGWVTSDMGFEGYSLTPQSFFGSAWHAHQRVFGSCPPTELAPIYANPVPLAPYHPLHMPAREVDLHGSFRRHLRANIRVLQMNSLRSCAAASRYNAMHPPRRRHWMACLPSGGAKLKVIVRLRSGYANIGRQLPWAPETRCPSCGDRDSIEHFLLRCTGLLTRRSELADTVHRITQEPLSVQLLLGFDDALPSQQLRKITTATADFVLNARRWP